MRPDVRVLFVSGYTDDALAQYGIVNGDQSFLPKPFDTITLTHTARDRSTFARGALEAARWVHGKRGWFSMRDVLGLTPPAAAKGAWVASAESLPAMFRFSWHRFRAKPSCC